MRPQCLGGLKVDDELDLGQLERQVGGFVALENFTCASEEIKYDTEQQSSIFQPCPGSD